MTGISEGAQIIIALISVGIPALAGVVIAGFKIIGTKIESARAAAVDAGSQATDAARFARPTGNGFAAGVREDLRLIIASQAQLRADVADLKEHTGRLDGRLDRLESNA